jgi:hypothetical protein
MDRLGIDIEQRLIARLEEDGTLLGVDLLDQYEPVATGAADYWSGFFSGGDPAQARSAANALTDLVDLDEPKDAASPLGVAITEALMEDKIITRAEAATILRVGRGQIHNLIRAGKLQEVPGKGVTRGSVIRRLEAVRRRPPT